jgi:hypothetical protein
MPPPKKRNIRWVINLHSQGLPLLLPPAAKGTLPIQDTITGSPPSRCLNDLEEDAMPPPALEDVEDIALSPELQAEMDVVGTVEEVQKFTEVMERAHHILATQDRLASTNKRSRYYTGTSDRTLRRQKKARRDQKENGNTRTILDFFSTRNNPGKSQWVEQSV